MSEATETVSIYGAGSGAWAFLRRQLLLNGPSIGRGLAFTLGMNWKTGSLIILSLFAFELSNAQEFCTKIFSEALSPARALDLQQDQAIFGKMTYVTDSMGTLQRLNLSRAFWAVADSQLRPSVALTKQLQVQTSADKPGAANLHLNLESPENIIALEIGSNLKFQRDPGFFNMRMNRNIDLLFTDGLNIDVGSRDVLEMKIIVGASMKKKSTFGNDVQRLETPQLFESPFTMIPKESNQQVTKFLWKNFKGIGHSETLSETLIVDHVWIVFKNPGKLKTVSVEFSGPVYAIQDVFKKEQNSDGDKYWRGIGRQFNFDKFMSNTPKYVFEPVSESFKNKIYENLFNRDHQQAALKALKNKTLENELKNLGFEYHIFAEKFGAGQFFKFFAHVEMLKIPIEEGDFGDYHGREAHALQLYAMTRGMTAAEVGQLRNLYQEIGKNAVFGWKIWSAVFDGPNPNYPTSPRFWKILELEGK